MGVLLLVVVLQTGAPSTQFERGRVAYERGEYARTIQLLRPLLYPEIRLATEGQVVQAHRMLGVAHLFEKQSEQAAQEFRKLLQLRPDIRFDTLLDPPQVVDFFNGVLREYEGELAKIEARRKEAEVAERRQREALERARRGPTVVERKVLRNSFAVSFIPFGTGQFQNGHRRKGWAFLVSEAVLASVSVGAVATNFAVYGFRPRRPCKPNIPPTGVMGMPRPGTTSPGPGLTDVCMPDYSGENTSKMLTRVQLISGGLFFAVAAWGIADAVLNFRPEIPIDVPAPGGAAGPRVARARDGLQLRLTPVALGSTLGAGLAFRF
jgi:hypothetical protein